RTHSPPISTLSNTGAAIRDTISGCLRLEGRLALARRAVHRIRVEPREHVLSERLDRLEHVLLVEGERQGCVDQLVDPEGVVHPDDLDDLFGRAHLPAAGGEAGLELGGRGRWELRDRPLLRKALRA